MIFTFTKLLQDDIFMDSLESFNTPPVFLSPYMTVSSWKDILNSNLNNNSEMCIYILILMGEYGCIYHSCQAFMEHSL